MAPRRRMWASTSVSMASVDTPGFTKVGSQSMTSARMRPARRITAISDGDFGMLIADSSRSG